MRQLKNDEHYVWHTSKRSKKVKIFLLANQSGQSLLEMLVTVSIGLIVSAGIATVFVFAMQQINQLIEKNETEQNSLWATYYLQKYLGQAVDVYAVNAVNPNDNITIDASHNTPSCPATAPGPANAVNCGYGQFLFNFDAHNNVNGAGKLPLMVGDYDTLAFFNREIGNPQGGGGVPGSNMMPSGIFVREPLTNLNPNDTLVEERSYSLNFNSTAGGVLDPNQSSLVYSRMHNLRVQRINCDVGAGPKPGGYNVEVVRDSDAAVFTCIPAGGFGGFPASANLPAPGLEKYWVKTVTFEIAFRYFKSSDRTAWDYFFDGGGPYAGNSYGDAAPAANFPAYRDILQTIKVNFNNNTLSTQSLTGGAGIPVRAGGPLYFFDSYVPMANAFGY